MVDFVRPTCWENEIEWTLVYDLLFKSNDKKLKIEGLKLVDVWRSRSEAKLPVAVDCTACLLGVLTVDSSSFSNVTCGSSCSEMQRRLALAMALVRFVNGMVDQGQKGVFARSVQILAEEIDIPDWLVDLRHDATHGVLPSLELLEAACHVALGWLQSHYWEKALQMFNKPKSLVAVDDFKDLLHQYLNEHWPLKRPKDDFFLPFSEKTKGMTSIDAIRNVTVPSLIRCGILLPSKIQIEEIESRGCQEPVKELVEFWKPLILWLQEKNSQFIILLTDSLLQHFEENHNECHARKFVSQFISTFVKDLQLDCGNEKLSCRILKHCLAASSCESNHLLSVIKNMIEISGSNGTDVEMLREVVMRHEDIFTEHCLVSDSRITADYSRLQEYFAVMPIADLNLSSLISGASEAQACVLGPWSTAAGISWGSIKEGRSLNCFESITAPSTHSSLLKLPGDIDAEIAKVLEVPNISEVDFGVAYSPVTNREAEEHDIQYNEGNTAVIPPYVEPSESELHHSQDVVLF